MRALIIAYAIACWGFAAYTWANPSIAAYVCTGWAWAATSLDLIERQNLVDAEHRGPHVE